MNRLIVALILMLFALGLFGCVTPEMTMAERMETFEAQVASLQALGVEGRVVVIWGGGHVAGQAFNLTGSNGFAEATLKAGPPVTQLTK